MNRSIRDVFEGACSNLLFDASLIKRLRVYESSFVGRNADHIEFFGGHLLGVTPVKFLPGDRMRWFDEIVPADELHLKEELYALPAINPEWIISSDVMNLSVAWVIHGIYTSTKLTPEQKHQGMMDALLILQYKYLTSLLFHYFRYPADRAVAEATYAALSDKFTLKQVGNWAALFRTRAESLLAKDSPHFHTVTVMDDDVGVVYFLNDVQGRIRDVLKNIYEVFARVHASGVTHKVTSAVSEHDGEKILKDKSKHLLSYTRYLNSIVSEKTSFIHQELVEVVEKLVHTATPSVFEKTLSWVSDNYRQSHLGIIEQVVNETLVHSFAYFDEHRQYVRGTPNLPDLLARLKGVYMSSRSTDPVLIALREKAETLVKMATQNKNESVLASVRTALLLYLVARALTMTHYAG